MTVIDPTKPHHYVGSWLHMGDCDICGNTQDHPNHLPDKPVEQGELLPDHEVNEHAYVNALNDEARMESKRRLDNFLQVLKTESLAIAEAGIKLIDQQEAVERAIEMLAHRGPNIIVCGVGKSGHIGRKLASTFCSLGHPATFVHGSEASHGDMGVIHYDDTVVIVISHSGETAELSDVLFYCHEWAIPIIAITSSTESTLGKMATVALAYGEVKEAGNLPAPTSSTAVALAIGDALAVTLAEASGRSAEDFRRYHPGGTLGARLRRVEDAMRPFAKVPCGRPTTQVVSLLLEMTKAQLGVAFVLSESGALIGIVTDGDVRRYLTEHAGSAEWATAGDLMTKEFLSISPEAYVTEAWELFQEHGVTSLVVADKHGLYGLLHIHDLGKV